MILSHLKNIERCKSWELTPKRDSDMLKKRTHSVQDDMLRHRRDPLLTPVGVNM
jgi:hypothetical protein